MEECPPVKRKVVGSNPTARANIKGRGMKKQKLKPFDYAFAKMMQEKMGVKFVDENGKPIEFEEMKGRK